MGYFFSSEYEIFLLLQEVRQKLSMLKRSINIPLLAIGSEIITSRHKDLYIGMFTAALFIIVKCGWTA